LILTSPRREAALVYDFYLCYFDFYFFQKNLHFAHPKNYLYMLGDPVINTF